jgi:hypothetical protein
MARKKAEHTVTSEPQAIENDNFRRLGEISDRVCDESGRAHDSWSVATDHRTVRANSLTCTLLQKENPNTRTTVSASNVK